VISSSWRLGSRGVSSSAAVDDLASFPLPAQPLRDGEDHLPVRDVFEQLLRGLFGELYNEREFLKRQRR